MASAMQAALDTAKEHREELAATKAALGLAEARMRELANELYLARSRELHLRDAVMLFATRCNAKPEEIAQLGVATLVKPDDDGPATVVWNTLDDLVAASSFAMKQQATVAKFRQLKAHFLTHQQAVSTMLDGLDKLCSRNVVTRVDVDALRRLRDDLAALIRRSL